MRYLNRQSFPRSPKVALDHAEASAEASAQELLFLVNGDCATKTHSFS